MTDRYRIDSHKLIYHVARVNSWLNGENVYPIYIEISPSGTCNHRCTFCALDFMKYRRRYLDAAILGEHLPALGNLGVKSIMYAGEGEPFLHPDMAAIVKQTKEAGIDVAFTTNGVLLTEELAEEILGKIEWIKVSIAAATRETYAKIHRTKKSDFDLVLRNMKYAAHLRSQKKYRCSLGMQILLLPENEHEVFRLAETARSIGMDYLVVKPYSQHLRSTNRRYENMKYSEYLHLGDELAKWNTKDFHVIFRARTMMKWDEAERPYKTCLALPFWSYIDAGGGVWGCSAYLGDERFLYGNIYENRFEEIWNGEKRLESVRMVESNLSIDQCRINCRMDEINRYLWELKNPPEHVNFI